MDEEIALVSRLIQTGEIDRVINDFGIEPSHFADPEMRAVYETIVHHKAVWRIPPSAEAIQREHPGFQPRIVNDDVGYLAQVFVGALAHRQAIEKWRELQEAIDDPNQRNRLPEVFAEHARDMAMLVPTRRLTRFSDMAERIIVRRQVQESGLPPGIMLGYEHADGLIKGVRPSEFVVFAGYSGKGKTQGMIRAAYNSYLQGIQAPLFISLEMEQDELWEKFDALATGTSSSAMRGYEITPEQYQKLEQAAARASKFGSDIIVMDDTNGSPTVDRVAALAERYRPGIICVDYISLMAAHTDIGEDWQRVTYISRSLKQLARALKTPVYAAAQSGRAAAIEGPTPDNIAYSTSIYQDCNVMLGFHQLPEWESIRKVEVRTLKNRGGKTGNAFEYWDRDRMVFEPWRMEHEWMGKQLETHAPPVMVPASASIPPPAMPSGRVRAEALMGS